MTEITKISKEFAKGILGDADISGTSWLVTDPLSAYLSFCGYENEVSQIPDKDDRPVLIIEFKEGAKFIPAGSDLQHLYHGFKDWQWI